MAKDKKQKEKEKVRKQKEKDKREKEIRREKELIAKEKERMKKEKVKCLGDYEGFSQSAFCHIIHRTCCDLQIGTHETM